MNTFALQNLYQAQLMRAFLIAVAIKFSAMVACMGCSLPMGENVKSLHHGTVVHMISSRLIGRYMSLPPPAQLVDTGQDVNIEVSYSWVYSSHYRSELCLTSQHLAKTTGCTRKRRFSQQSKLVPQHSAYLNSRVQES